MRSHRSEILRLLGEGCLIQQEHYNEALQAALQLASQSGPVARAIGPIFEAEIFLMTNRLEDARTLTHSIHEVLKVVQDDDAESFMDELQAMLNLYSEDSSVRQDGIRVLSHIGEEITRISGFDGWGEGFLRLTRLIRVARMTGNASLVEELTDYLNSLDSAQSTKTPEN